MGRSAGAGWSWLVDPQIPRITVEQNLDGAFVPYRSAVGPDEVTSEPDAMRLRPADLAD